MNRQDWIEILTNAYIVYDVYELSDKDCKELIELLRCQDDKRN